MAPEFEVDCRLAAGGMGIVFVGREVALDRRVAIKVLRPELATAVALERFLQEARLLARLQHPNILPVHRADERDGLAFYVMDFLEGQTLADRLAGGAFQGDLIHLGHDLLRALTAAHEVGIIHRDVKPHNIFFVRDRAVLGDFGIARDDSQDTLDLTEEGVLLGTRGYMAPEQLLGEPATGRSDQYSAAAVLYQAACGRMWKAGVDPAAADWSGVLEPLASTLRRALAVNPTERYPDLPAVRRSFDGGTPRRRHPVTSMAAIAAVVAIVLALAALAYRQLVPPQRFEDHRALAVLPFTTSGGSGDSLGMVVAATTNINLTYFPRLTRTSSERAAAWQQDHPMDGPAAARVALEVDWVATGQVEARGDTLVLTLIVTDSAASTPLQAIRVTGPDQARDLGRRAALAIGARVTGRQVGELTNLASRNPQAALMFRLGEALFENDEWESAAEAFERAWEMDTTFVLARWQGLVAKVWARQYSWEEAADLATCCADQLPPLQAGLVRAMAEPNLMTRFAAFESLKQQYDGVSLFLLLYASDLFHRGPLLGFDLQVSLDMFEGAVHTGRAGAPWPAYDQLVWGKTRLGDREAAHRWLEAREELNARASVKADIVDFLQVGYDLRWVPWRAHLKLWLLRHYAGEGTLKLLANFFRFSATWDIPEGQDAIGRVIASRLLTADRASGLEAQALARLTWGQVAPGLAHLDSAAALFKTEEAALQQRQWRLMLPVLGAGRASAAEESAARAWLVQQAAAGPLAARARWTLALDALGHADTVAATGIVESLADLSKSDSSAGQLSALAAAVLQGGRDPRAALASSAPLLGLDSPAPGNDVFSRSVLHLSRASWFERIGQPEGAAREILWYENSDAYQFPTHEAQKMEVDAVASVAARVTRARLLLATGDSPAACRMLSRVRELWRNADASLAPSAARADSLYRERCR